MTSILGLHIERLAHDGFKISDGYTIVYVDPFQISEQQEKADILLVTHEHYDHCSIEDIQKVIKHDTVIVTIPGCASKLNRLPIKSIKMMTPNQGIDVAGMHIETIPAYNINKFRAPGVPFHPKEDGRVGFVFILNGKRIFHAGDTDFTPEMAALKDINIALVPVSGTYVMTAEEAAKAVNTFKPEIAIPMHYGVIVGSVADAEKFKQLAKVEVLIL
ncbi:MBL fold metallo-hydrolase [Candidatus Woesearchaeota archaeon]|nr:MBL fold metallo-hydrolase [Candidatus Woesearchaeota archaeon]